MTQTRALRARRDEVGTRRGRPEILATTVEPLREQQVTPRVPVPVVSQPSNAEGAE